LEDEARELKNKINQKEISLSSANSEIATKLEEIQALHSRVEELEQDVSLAEKRLSEMDSLKRKSEQEYLKLSEENVSLVLAKMELKDTLVKKKDELMQVNEDLLLAQKSVIEKDSFLQETNTLLLEQFSKASASRTNLSKMK
ncbi:17030_t:CDS:1, partial [Acaulospora colombiana]